jgi:hypothetical protein
MQNPTAPEPITVELSELDQQGKPIESSTRYLLAEPQVLFAELVQSLNEESEQSFETETQVNSKDTITGEKTEEFYLVRFTRNRGWGLMGKLNHPTEGVFRFYLDFLVDAI